MEIEAMETIEIPPDVLFEILKRVPPIYIGIIRSVNRLWRSTTRDPKFAAAVADFGRAPPSVVALLRTGRGNIGRRLIRFSPHAAAASICQASPEVETITLPSHYEQCMSSSCNGLILLYDIYGGMTVVNPITGERPKVPNPSCHSLGLLIPTPKCGLGFNPESNEYKIVRIYCISTVPATFNVEVHTVGSSESWRQLCSTTEMPDSVATVNGVMYWGISKTAKILSVDLQTEVVTTIPLPYLGGNFLLNELQGCLSCTDKKLFNQSAIVWVRKPLNESTYVWRYQFWIPILQALPWGNVPGGEPKWAAPMGIYEGRLMLMKTDTCLGFFDMRTGRFKILYRNEAMNDAQLHVNSLVSVKEMPPVQKKVKFGLEYIFLKYLKEFIVLCILFFPNLLVGFFTIYFAFEH